MCRLADHRVAGIARGTFERRVDEQDPVAGVGDDCGFVRLLGGGGHESGMRLESVEARHEALEKDREMGDVGQLPAQ